MAIRLDTTTDTVEEVKQAIGEVAETVTVDDDEDLIGEVETQSEGNDKPESGAASEADKTKDETQKGKAKGEEDLDEKDLPTGVKKAITKLRQDRRELREERRELTDRLSRLEAAQRKPEADPARAAKAEPLSGRPRPTRDQFANDEDPDGAFVEALTDWKSDEKAAAQDQERQARDTNQESERIQAEYTERVTVAETRYEDWDEAFDDLPDSVPATPVMQYVMLTSPVGPDMSYYLAKHPDEAVRIGSLDRAGQIRAMGKIEGKVEDIVAALEAKKGSEDPKPEVKPNEALRKPSKAPKPTTPVKSSTQTVKSKTEQEEASHVDHIKFDRDYEKERTEHRRHR